MRKSLVHSLLAGALVVVGIATTGAGAAQASTVHPAVSCYGDYCSGLDPQSSGCAADAKTVASSYDSSTNSLLELRWSPTCKTNWARVNTTSPAWIKAVQPTTGYTQWGTLTAAGSPYSWSRQIYSPSLCVYAQANFGSGGPTLTTACI